MAPLANNNCYMNLEDSTSSFMSNSAADDHQSSSFCASTTAQTQQKNNINVEKCVRFFEQVTVRRIPNIDTLSDQERRRLWWSDVESSLIEREVFALAHLMEMKRLPKGKQQYAIVRGIVGHTTRVLAIREAKMEQLYKGIASIQLCAINSNKNNKISEEEQEEAKVLFTEKLISQLCRKITLECEQNALRIGAMDAAEADLVYKEADDASDDGINGNSTDGNVHRQ
jgi:hypothetical protein